MILAVISTIQLVVRQRRAEFRREQESNPKLCNAGAVLDHLRTNWELAVIWIPDKSRVDDGPTSQATPGWSDSSTGRAQHWHCNGSGFQSYSHLTLTTA